MYAKYATNYLFISGHIINYSLLDIFFFTEPLNQWFFYGKSLVKQLVKDAQALRVSSFYQ